MEKLDRKDETCHFKWTKICWWKNVLFYIACVFSVGILVIACINYPTLRMHLTTSTCDAQDAEFIEVKESNPESTTYVPVESTSLPEGEFRSFEKYGIRYIASNKTGWAISRVPSAPENFTDVFVVGTAKERPSRGYLRCVYGQNVMKIEAVDAGTIALKEIVSPFYLFQYFAVGVWLATDYIIYSVIVFFITVVSIVFCVKSKLFNLKRLHDLAGVRQEILLYNMNENSTAASRSSDLELVPGDCFIVESDKPICCDAILIRGRVVVDESMLTGESVPVTKTPFVQSEIDQDATKRTANILYSGTHVKVVNQGSEAVAMVYKTGFRSARGELINELVAPKVDVVQFLPDALYAILFMVIITTAIFGWSASQLKLLGTEDILVFIAYLTALTIAVPPGLVACLSIGTSLSVARLALLNISITDTAKLTAAGYVSCVCFDKTGTLTDENIKLQGTKLYVETAEHAVITKEIMAACHSLSLVDGVGAGDPLEVELLNQSGWILKLTADGKGLAVEPPGELAGSTYTLLRQFEFSPEKLRAGTVVRRPNGTYNYLVKGSPEMLSKICDPKTIPSSLDDDLADLGKNGFRVLAMAYKSYHVTEEVIMSKSQHVLEENLIFLGLVYFSNKLKKDTFPATIQSLVNADIGVKMITGDHFHTAAAISAECNIINPAKPMIVIDGRIPIGKANCDVPELCIVDPKTEKIIPGLTIDMIIEKHYHIPNARKQNPLVSWLALPSVEEKTVDMETGIELKNESLQLLITGAGYKILREEFPDKVEPIVRLASVFARMKPADKKTVVEELMKPDKRVNSREQCRVMFCGDGANDMEALSASTVGVSLCDTATTVAAAIVSTDHSPIATVEVLKEGRCSLITAYILVNFNIMYAIIQLFMTCYLNNIGLVFGDYMYLVQDMFYSLFLGLAISDIGPQDVLSTKLPPGSLFQKGLLIKLLLQLMIFPSFQAITLQVLKTQKWYSQFETDDPLVESYANEGAALNIIALAQLMIAAVVVTIGKPFRKPFYTSWKLMVLLLIHTSFIMYLMFGENNDFMVGLDNKPAPHKFSGILIGLIAANAFVSAVATKIADMFL